MSSHDVYEIKPLKGPVESMLIVLKDGPKFLMILVALLFFVIIGLIISLRATQASQSEGHNRNIVQTSPVPVQVLAPSPTEIAASPSIVVAPTNVAELGKVLRYASEPISYDVELNIDRRSSTSKKYKATLAELVSSLQSSEPRSQALQIVETDLSFGGTESETFLADNYELAGGQSVGDELIPTREDAPKERLESNSIDSLSKVSIAPSRKAQVGMLIAAYEETKNEQHLLQLFDLWKQRPGDDELFDVFTTFINKKEDIVWVEKIYLQAVEHNIDNTLVYRRWAGFYYQKNLMAIANKILSEKYELAKRRKDSNYLHLYAAVQSKLGNHEMENQLYHDLKSIQPQQWRWQLAVAQNYEKTGRFPQSEAAYQKLMGYRDVPHKVRDFAQSMLVQLAQDY